MLLVARLPGILERGNKLTIVLKGGFKLFGVLQKDNVGYLITNQHTEYKQVYYLELDHVVSIGEKFEKKD